MQQMLVTLPESFQLAMVMFEGFGTMVVGECNSGLRGSAEKRRRRRSKGPVGNCKGYVACLALGWEKAGAAGVGATAAGCRYSQGSAIGAGQGKARQGGAGQMATGYGKVAGRQAEGERALVCLYTARLCCPVTGALANNVG